MDARAWAGFAAERLDRVALLLALVAGLAGALLALAYRDAATPALAHGAVAALPAALRGAHAWAGSLALVALLLSLLRTWVDGNEAGPATWRWMARVGALGLLLAGLLLGGILPWDHHAWESWQHVLAAAGQPLPAEPAAPLALLATLHAATGLGALALLAWPIHGLRTDLRTLAPLALAPILLGLAAPPVHGPAPIAGLRVGAPEWPFLWLVPLQAGLGPAVLPLALVAVGALLAALPWLGSGWGKGPRARAAAAAVAAWLAMTLWGALG